MAISIYDATINAYLQILDAVSGFQQKARAHLAESGEDPEEMPDFCLIDDMLPYRFQVISVVHHSLGAIIGVREGVFSPPKYVAELDLAALQSLLDDARSELASFARDEIDQLQGRSMEFRMGDLRLPFLAEDFLLTFSLPNFYFHATTAYDILRMKGVPLSKRDFLGRMRLNK